MRMWLIHLTRETLVWVTLAAPLDMTVSDVVPGTMSRASRTVNGGRSEVRHIHTLTRVRARTHTRGLTQGPCIPSHVDIVGCEFDRSNDQISYYLNGEPLGIAFTKISDDIKLFPAVRYPYIHIMIG
jgi:hypothetical protein